MGDDWAGRFDDLAGLCEVVYLPRTTGISTTKIKLDVIEKTLM
jgi:glycerol-3-phosphate cytidylyltransferase